MTEAAAAQGAASGNQGGNQGGNGNEGQSLGWKAGLPDELKHHEAFTPFKTLPVPPPVEDDKTLDARLDAVIARNAPSATASSRKGVDNGLARYGAMGSALRQAVIHPHSTRPSLSAGGRFYLARQGDISTLP